MARKRCMAIREPVRTFFPYVWIERLAREGAGIRRGPNVGPREISPYVVLGCSTSAEQALTKVPACNERWDQQDAGAFYVLQQFHESVGANRNFRSNLQALLLECLRTVQSISIQHAKNGSPSITVGGPAR